MGTRVLHKDRTHERGAVLVHAAIAFMGLLAFSAFTIDYGVMWVSRRQAQNAADAAALAAAHALAFDNTTDWTAAGRAKQVARAIAEAHQVWDKTPALVMTDDNPASPSSVTVDDTGNDVQIGTCPDGIDACVRVDIVRMASGGGAVQLRVPTYFAQIVGLASQDVRATATAEIVTGNASDCIRPWAVMDKWEEHVKCGTFQGNSCANWVANNAAWTVNDTFDKYTFSGQGGLDPTIPTPTPGYDVYRPPTATDPGTGFRPFNPDGTPGPDYGFLLTLKLGSGSTNDRISAGWFKALDLPCSAPNCPQNSGAQKYGWAITHCVGHTIGIGDSIPIETGNMTGQTGHNTYQSVGNSDPALAEIDPGAYWDPTTKTVKGSCAPGFCSDGHYYVQSPRIVPVPLGDIDAYLQANPSGSGGSIRIVNIFGFFIITPAQAATLGFDLGQGNANDVVYGAMITYPGLTQGTSTVTEESAFLKQIILVR